MSAVSTCPEPALNLEDPYIHAYDFDWEPGSIGEFTLIIPHPGETVEETANRMTKIADRYRESHDLHYLVMHDEGGVLIKQMKKGCASRLGQFLSLCVGERTCLMDLGDDRERAEGIAGYLSRSGKRKLVVVDEEVDEHTWIERVA